MRLRAAASAVAIEAVLAHDRRGLHRAVELLLFGVVVQDPQLQLVVFDAGGGAQRLQARAAVERELHDLGDVRVRARRHAFEEEAQPPRPLVRVHAQAEQQRRVVAPQPLEDLSRRVRIGPRLRMAHGDLPAVGERSLEAGALAAIGDDHFVALLGEIPGGRGADDTGTQDENFHGKRGLTEDYTLRP
jgi:hypothetical protein